MPGDDDNKTAGAQAGSEAIEAAPATPSREVRIPADDAEVDPGDRVEVATDGLKVEPNHVDVIPPNSHLAILQGACCT